MNDIETPWLDIDDGEKYSKRGKGSIYKAVKRGELRAARLGGRGELLFRREWLDEWIEARATPVMVTPRRFVR